MLGKGLSVAMHNIIYTDRGRFVLSIILGLGLATLFKRICHEKNCFKFIGPKQNDLRDQIFSFDSDNSKCFKMKEEMVKCDSNKKIINFSDNA